MRSHSLCLMCPTLRIRVGPSAKHAVTARVITQSLISFMSTSIPEIELPVTATMPPARVTWQPMRSSTSTKLKVMGVELMVLGAKDALHTTDEVVTYAEPARGVYKKLIVRDGHLAGAILLGDSQMS